MMITVMKNRLNVKDTVLVNDNSTNHVYMHDFMYVYMLLQNRTSSLRQV